MAEVGRGTGTEDGLSIAWAVCEELLNNIKCRTLFATHYHELAGIDHPAMANRSMDVDERSGKIVFLRKIREGSASESYGLHVAALAGIPERVLKRAGEIMLWRRKEKPAVNNIPLPQSLPESSRSGQEEKISKQLSELDINAITPLEALNLMQQWKMSATGEEKPASNQKIKNSSKYAAAEPSLFRF